LEVRREQQKDSDRYIVCNNFILKVLEGGRKETWAFRVAARDEAGNQEAI